MKVLSTLAVASAMMVMSLQPAAAGEPMSDRQIKQLFPGHFEARVMGFKVKIAAGGNGSLVGKFGSQVDKGRWSIQDGRLCIMLESWMSGQTKCSAVVQAGGWYRTSQVAFRKL